MNKKVILLTIVILIIALTLGACDFVPLGSNGNEHTHSFETRWTSDSTHHWHAATCSHTSEVKDKAPHEYDSNNRCVVCNYQKEIPEPPTPSKKIEEIIAEYLLELGDNFSVSAEIKNNFNELLMGGQKYKLLLDGNKVYADNNGEEYYVEESENEVVYLYVKTNDMWHKSVVTEDFEYPTNIADMLTDMLSNVNWKSYDEKTGVATGNVEYDGNQLLIECVLNDEPTVTIYKYQHIPIIGNVPIEVGTVVIFDIGNTTVELPSEYVDDTELPDPETPNNI